MLRDAKDARRSKGAKDLEQRSAKALEWKGAEAEVLRYHRSRGALGAEERVEQRKIGSAVRAGPDKDKLVGPSRARTKQMDQGMQSS